MRFPFRERYFRKLARHRAQQSAKSAKEPKRFLRSREPLLSPVQHEQIRQLFVQNKLSPWQCRTVLEQNFGCRSSEFLSAREASLLIWLLERKLKGRAA
jgi:hypothetical protein